MNGIPCKHCGWCEADHEGGTGVNDDPKDEGANTVYPGRSHSLSNCLGYVPESSEEERDSKLIS